MLSNLHVYSYLSITPESYSAACRIPLEFDSAYEINEPIFVYLPYSITTWLLICKG